MFGYNENDLEFSLLGYNEKQLFSKTKVPYDLFRKGFQNLSNIKMIAIKFIFIDLKGTRSTILD